MYKIQIQDRDITNQKLRCLQLLVNGPWKLFKNEKPSNIMKLDGAIYYKNAPKYSTNKLFLE
jgi:hypothetical protein